jgi:hypothetical protein
MVLLYLRLASLQTQLVLLINEALGAFMEEAVSDAVCIETSSNKTPYQVSITRDNYRCFRIQYNSVLAANQGMSHEAVRVSDYPAVDAAWPNTLRGSSLALPISVSACNSSLSAAQSLAFQTTLPYCSASFAQNPSQLTSHLSPTLFLYS